MADHGLFIPLARTLAKTYKKVYYWSDWEEGFPTINKYMVGDGFEDIECVEDIWQVKKDADLFCFPDLQWSGLQLELESQGYPVWGGRKGDSLELSREKFHKVLAQVGLDVPKFKRIIGLTKLREHLKHEENKYIKISKYRGSLETCHWRNWSIDELMLDVWAVRFGPAKELIPFLVFDAIDSEMEMGGDTYVVDGEWPDMMLHGTEAKDKAYFSTVTKRTDMPQQIQDVLDAFGPVLKPYRSRQQWSMEVRRVSDNEAYFIDPTLRGGLPSTSSQLLNMTNFAEVIYAGAHGVMIQPDYDKMYTAEVILTTKSDRTSWSACEVPKELEGHMMLGNCCEIDGRICFPHDDSNGDSIGWLVANGDTPAETLDNIKELVKLLPSGVNGDTDALADVLKEIHTEQADGIEFGDKPIPAPEIILED